MVTCLCLRELIWKFKRARSLPLLVHQARAKVPCYISWERWIIPIKEKFSFMIKMYSVNPQKDWRLLETNAWGLSFSFTTYCPSSRALENVMIPGLIANKEERKVKKRGLELLTMLGLADRINHKPSELSGGEQQRTAVARAMINAPDLILADEPSGNLDSKNAEDLHALFLQLRKDTGQTFIVVTHNEHLSELADRRIELKDGIINK